MDARNPDTHRRALLFELLLVLFLAWAPSFFSATLIHGQKVERSILMECYGLVGWAGLIAFILFLLWRNNESFRHVGLRKTRWWSELLWAFVIYCVAWFAWGLVMKLQTALGATAAQNQMDEPQTGIYRILLPVFLLISMIYEELIYRGYLINRLRRLTGSAPAAIFGSALLFTSVHPYDLWGRISVFCFGVVMGVFFLLGRSLPRLVLAHTAFNLAISYEWWRF